jgi:hypothetical protein
VAQLAAKADRERLGRHPVTGSLAPDRPRDPEVAPPIGHLGDLGEDSPILNDVHGRPGFDDALAAAQRSVSDGRATVPQAVREILSGQLGLVAERDDVLG